MLTIAVQPITWSFSPYSFSLNALKRANISTFCRFYSYSTIKYTIPVLQVFIKILNKKTNHFDACVYSGGWPLFSTNLYLINISKPNFRHSIGYVESVVKVFAS